MRASSLAIAALGVLLAAAGHARAADSDLEAHLREQLRATTIALRDAQDQNATLAARQKELTTQLTAAQQEIEQLKAKAGGGAGDADKVAAAEDAAAKSEEQLDQARALLEKWKTAYNQAADVARARDAAARDFETRFNRSSAGLTQCMEKNGKLETLAGELLDRIDKHTLLDDVIEGEPVTQIYRVKLENILQDYQDRLRDQEVRP
jgi:chromosome segregation ATPase